MKYRFEWLLWGGCCKKKEDEPSKGSCSSGFTNCSRLATPILCWDVFKCLKMLWPTSRLQLQNRLARNDSLLQQRTAVRHKLLVFWLDSTHYPLSLLLSQFLDLDCKDSACLPDRDPLGPQQDVGWGLQDCQFHPLVLQHCSCYFKGMTKTVAI